MLIRKLEDVYLLAKVLQGKSLAWLLENTRVDCGSSIQSFQPRNKGWVGRCVEQWLGVPSLNEKGPDFSDLNLEIKTVPIGKHGTPKESTFLTYAPLTPNSFTLWHQSSVYHKVQYILWVPIFVPGLGASLEDRYFLEPFFWRPTKEQWACLRQDWDELTTLISLGEMEMLQSYVGDALQLRPKALNSEKKLRYLSSSQSWEKSGPKGFYLRACFTKQIFLNGEGVVPTVGVEPTTY